MNFTGPLSMIRSNFKNEKQCWTSTDGIASDTGKCQSRNHVQATFRPQRRRTANPCAVPCSEATRRSANGRRGDRQRRGILVRLCCTPCARRKHYLGAAQRQRRVVIRPRFASRPGLCLRTESTHPRSRRCRGPNGSPLRAVVQKLLHTRSMATKCPALWPYLAVSHLLRD